MQKMEPQVFDPTTYEVFHVDGWSFDQETMTVGLHYRLDQRLSLTETIDFSALPKPASEAQRTAFERCMSLLSVFAGTSYYKLAAPQRVVVNETRLSASAVALATEVYRQGLAEFAYRNLLPGVLNVGLEVTTEDHSPLPLGGEGTLVPVGGGKDSIVTLELLRRAGEKVTAFSVGDSAPIVSAARVAGTELVVVRRTIDPQIRGLNQAGAYNGHIPVTAINSVLACAAAVLLGCESVAMSNERTASAPSLYWQGAGVNHQWSKSIDFETQFAAVVHDDIAPDLTYFSMLRPLSELAIARIFSGMPEYFDTFISCNQYYKQTGATASWCGECDKCRFVFLLLAAWLDRKTVTGIFGRDLLAEPANLAGYRELAGLAGPRPLDCVGEVDEVVHAFAILPAEWRSAEVVAAVTAELGSHQNDSVMEFSAHPMPARFEEILRAAL